MTERNFISLLKNQWIQGHFLCVGLDADYAKIPEFIKVSHSVSDNLFQFNKAIIDSTYDLVCAYKPNLAFYEAHGVAGFEALHQTITYIHQLAPQIPVILDAKRGDIGNTNIGYVQEAFDYLQADAITLQPYMGGESLQPFLERKNKGIIILCRTSNPGSGEFQNLMVDGKPLYHIVAENVAKQWNIYGNCGVVAGATYPEELAIIRKIIGEEMPILIPGIGTQGGDLQKTISASKNKKGSGMIISASRSIIYASSDENFNQAARVETLKLNQEIQQILSS